MTSILRIEWNGSALSLEDALQKQHPEVKPTSSVESLTIVLLEEKCYNIMDLASMAPYLTKTANVSVEIPMKNEAVLKDVHTSFLLAGLQSQSEQRDSNNDRIVLLAQRGFSIAAGGAAAPIRIVLNDDDDDDDGMVDEDALLFSDASNLVKPPSAMNDVASKDDCSGREPCADCTCGRSSENKNPKEETAGETTVKKSSCGKCGLGDAFRCASCPYLGKPAFKPGEEHLVLDLQDDL